MPLRSVLSTVTVAALAVAAATAGAAPLRAVGISPKHVVPGRTVTLSAPTGRKTAPCLAQLIYADGMSTTVGPRRPTNRRIVFKVRIPGDTALGPASWRIRCVAPLADGTFVVVKRPVKRVAAGPHIEIAKQGFSQHANRYGGGSLLSYGLLLHNSSPTEDAEKVYVIVNMVSASGALAGSKAQTVAVIPADGTFALGDSLSLGTQAPVTRLEITIRVGSHEPTAKRAVPDFANVSIVPSVTEPGFVGEVDGEVVNDTTPQTLRTAHLSIVVLDGAGNPVGGGTGSTIAAVPSGARFVFRARTGFGAIPLDQAVSAIVSSEPTWESPTGS